MEASLAVLKKLAYRDSNIIVGEDESGVDAGQFTVRHFDLVFDRYGCK